MVQSFLGVVGKRKAHHWEMREGREFGAAQLRLIKQKSLPHRSQVKRQ